MWDYKGNLSVWILEQLQGLILPVHGLLRRNTSPHLLNTSIPFIVIFFCCLYKYVILQISQTATFSHLYKQYFPS